MILRTPPPRKRRADDSRAPESPGSDRRLVIYEDPVPESSHGPSEQMLCTYQCRQMNAEWLGVDCVSLGNYEVKAEFLESLNSAEKQVRDYQSRLEASNENFCKAEADRKKFRDQFFYAEQELAAVKGREKALQEQLLKEVNDSQGRFKKQIQSYSELEGKLQNEMNLRKNAESSAALAEEKASALEGN
ncbi:Mitotic spindle checkpoint protein MAD1 [Vitis vinifera]|uniref:Mitotic spindle checkpoint protein MAD1 n=1 Tax=Vitis vinifera TaxID=29760 RepID=A0A438E9J9_VITVI|nr:Mitotic spindle checkpoint protein MAD1 [Vitis vinifera]